MSMDSSYILLDSKKFTKGDLEELSPVVSLVLETGKPVILDFEYAGNLLILTVIEFDLDMANVLDAMPAKSTLYMTDLLKCYRYMKLTSGVDMSLPDYCIA